MSMYLSHFISSSLSVSMLTFSSIIPLPPSFYAFYFIFALFFSFYSGDLGTEVSLGRGRLIVIVIARSDKFEIKQTNNEKEKN